MGKHLNPLEKEFLIRQYKCNTKIKLSDFCKANHISDAAFRKWLKQYDADGLEVLTRSDAEIRDVLPDGIDRTEEGYKREILKLRIENERLKKLYRGDESRWGMGICSFHEDHKTHGYRWTATFIRLNYGYESKQAYSEGVSTFVNENG